MPLRCLSLPVLSRAARGGFVIAGWWLPRAVLAPEPYAAPPRPRRSLLRFDGVEDDSRIALGSRRLKQQTRENAVRCNGGKLALGERAVRDQKQRPALDRAGGARQLFSDLIR